MDLVINAFGTKIGCTGERILLSFPNSKETQEYPIRRLEKIVILSPSSLTSNAVQLALKHEVDIVYMGNFNKPIGRIFASEPKGFAELRRAQLAFSTSEKSFILAKEIVRGKCINQIQFMRYIDQIYGKNIQKEIAQAIGMLETLSEVQTQPENKAQLLGTEGYIADRYFAGLKKFFSFPGRKPHGRDKFNSALNYGYGILYNEVDRACLYVGLDPYLGVYHSERYGKPSLVLDLVEEFRVPVVDMALFPLFFKKELEEEKYFEKLAEDVYQLSIEGKALVVDAVLAQLNKNCLWRDKQYSLKAIIENEVRALGRYFMGKEDQFSTFSIQSLLTPYE